MEIARKAIFIKDFKFEEIFDTKEIFENETLIDLSSKIKLLLATYIKVSF